MNEYFTDDSPSESGKTLVPFLSSDMCTFTLYTVVILAGLVVATWPWRGFVPFVREQRIPYSFPIVFIGLLVIVTYLHLRLGRGEIAVSRVFTRVQAHRHVVPAETVYPFTRYALIIFCLHILFWLLPCFPILLLVTALSGFSLLTFGKALSIVFTAALLCRLFGFVMYLLWDNASVLGYLFARVFLAASIYATGFLVPVINPIRVLLDLDSNRLGGSSLMSAYTVYTLISLAGIGLLSILAELLVSRKGKKENIT